MGIIVLFLLVSQVTWQNTGELSGATQVYAITKGDSGFIFAGTKAAPDAGVGLDSGWVYVSKDLWNWQVCESLPGVQEGVFCLIDGVDDTLFAGTGMWSDLPRVFKSSDRGQSWVILNDYGTYRPGSRVTAFFEDNLGILHLGMRYFGMSAAIPRHSTDRGTTWLVDGGTINYNSEHHNFFQSADGTMYFGSWGVLGGVHRSTDNGTTWTPADTLDKPNNRARESFCFVEIGNDSILVGAGYDTARVFLTSNKGVSWQRLGAGYLNEDLNSRVTSLFIDSRGFMYAGTYPRAEVFISYNNGTTWNSTGTLSGATNVYEFIEVVKTVGRLDSHFVYAATGPNGDVFRSNWNIIAVEEQAGTKQPGAVGRAIPNPFVKATRISSCGDEMFRIYNLAGEMVAEQRGDCIGKDLAPGIYFIKQKTGTGGMTRIVKIK